MHLHVKNKPLLQSTKNTRLEAASGCGLIVSLFVRWALSSVRWDELSKANSMLLTGKTPLDIAIRDWSRLSLMLPVWMLRPMTNEDCSLLAGHFHDHSINYTINTLCVTLHRERETEFVWWNWCRKEPKSQPEKVTTQLLHSSQCTAYNYVFQDASILIWFYIS